MKHFNSCLFLLCCFAIHATGQRTKTIEVPYQFNDFTLTEDHDMLAISSSLNSVRLGSESTDPGLPVLVLHYLIGNDEEFSNVSVNCEDSICSQGVLLRGNPTWHSISSVSENIRPTYTSAQYPLEIVKYIGTHIVDGYHYITFHISPFSFRTRDNELLYHSNMTLDVQLNSVHESRSKVGKAMRNVVKSIVLNSDEMNSLYETSKRNQIQSRSSGTTSFDYLIITRDSLKDTFQKLADWKTRKGVTTKVMTIEQIYATYNGQNPNYQPRLQRMIKNVIKDYHDNLDTRYVLLGGDENIVPSEVCHLQYGDYIPIPKTASVCDLYYAALNTMDWDGNHNNTYGEEADSIDMRPLITVSRLSVSSNSDALNQIHRIIGYERDPSPIWNDSVLLMGCKKDTVLYDSQSDVAIKGERIAQALNQYTNNENGIFSFYDTRTDHPNNSNYDVTVSHFNEQLAKGYSFIHIDGTGSESFLRLENDNYYNSDASNCFNPRYSIITSYIHSTNDFELDCLSEAFMRNPNSGIIAYWGSANLSMKIVDERYLGDADHLILSFYQYLFNPLESYNFGENINKARLAHISDPNGKIPYSDYYRYLLMCMNPLGDPEMPIFTRTPMCFDGLDIELMNNNQLHFSFTNYNMEFGLYNLCVMSIDDNGESFYEILENIDGRGVTLNLPVGHDYSICATQPRFKPYIVNVYRRGYVQNDTIANESIIWSNQAMIGRDVTAIKPQGPVVVEKDQMTIKAPQGVTIKNSFTLKKGATLVIDPTIQYIWHEPEEQ